MKPWLGRRAAVFLSGLRGQGDADFAVVVATKDGDKAEDALAQSRRRDDAKQVTRSSRGSSYLAGSEGGVRAAMDTLNGGPSLVRAPAYRRATARVNRNGLATFYVGGTRLVDAIGSTGGNAAIAIGQLRALSQF